MNYCTITKRLSKLGCYELPRRGSGSHRKWFNQNTQQVASIPDWAGRDLKIGTIRAIIRQLGIEWSVFEDT